MFQLTLPRFEALTDLALDPILAKTTRFKSHGLSSLAQYKLTTGPVETLNLTEVIAIKTPKVVIDRPFLFLVIGQRDYHSVSKMSDSDVLLAGYVNKPTTA